jgi:esterase/lipase
MRTGVSLFFLLALTAAFSPPTHAQERLGIVLLHGKAGLPQQLSPMAAALTAHGHLTAQPEMCWSRTRIYDRLYADCLREIDTAADQLRARGATAIVVLGMSLGGNAALGYGATRTGLKGIITLVAGHAPEFISRRPEIAQSLEYARARVAAGQGDVKTTFMDVNTRAVTYNFEVTTTPNIYVNFFAANSPAVMPANAQRLTAPLLYVAAIEDPIQRGRGYIFDRAPPRPLNRYVVVKSDHIGTPAASEDVVTGWIKELVAP